MNRAILKATFEKIKKEYFPRWDRQGKWKVKIASRFLPSTGRCFPEKKEIHISPRMSCSLECLLIHEICHTSAFTHEKKWQERLIKKAKIAKRRGEETFASELIKEVESYKTAEVLYAKDIYSRIGECLIDCPNVSYKNLIKYLSKELGMYPYEFEKTYKKSRDVYKNNKRQREFMKILREGGEMKVKGTKKEKEREVREHGRQDKGASQGL